MVTIEFDQDHYELIEQVAREREIRYANVPSNYGTGRSLTKDIAGVAGELAVALYTGLPWTGRDNDYGADVGDLEVRTRRTHNGRLCLHDKELERKDYKSGQRFVLARYMSSYVELVGWSWVSIILRKGEYIDGRTYLPNRLLHNIETVLL
jgi:hypothetical protein